MTPVSAVSHLSAAEQLRLAAYRAKVLRREPFSPEEAADFRELALKMDHYDPSEEVTKLLILASVMWGLFALTKTSRK